MDLGTSYMTTGASAAMGSIGPADYSALQKALGVGVETDIAAITAGQALQVQALEQTLVSVAFQMKDIAFFNRVPKDPTRSTIDEYSVLRAYGPRRSVYVGAGETPAEGDADLDREFALIKYYRSLCSVDDPALLVQTIENPEDVQTMAGTMRILEGVEFAMFFGDAGVIPKMDNGLIAQIAANGGADNIMDLRNTALDDANIREAAKVIRGNYGWASDMFCSLGAQTTIDRLLDESKRVWLPVDGTKIAAGYSVDVYRTSFGNFNIVPDVFINPEEEAPMDTLPVTASGKQPNPPTFTVTANAGPIGGSLWTALTAGAYEYRVSAINHAGESVAAAAASATVAATGSVTVACTVAGTGEPANGFAIYRETAPGSGVHRLVRRVAAVAGVGTYTDLDEWIPGTSVAFMLDITPQGPARTMKLKELFTLYRKDLAPIGAFKWWLLNYGAVLQVQAPRKHVIIKNIAV